MTGEPDDKTHGVEASLETLHRLYEDTAADIRSYPDPQTAFQHATRLTAALRAATTAAGELRADLARRIWETEQLSLAGLADRLGVSKARADQIIRAAKGARGLTQLNRDLPDHVPEKASRPEPQPVVAAIVTSDRGVLVGKRNDGKPPWTFIAGEIEPGESATDAVVREVKEETGLLVRAAEREIGRRVHPKTGRTMIYLACYPLGKTDVFVGDEDELAEVRWVSLGDAEELLPGLFEPVHLHLTHELG